MVTARVNVCSRQDLTPCAEGAGDDLRKIPGPLYAKADVLKVLASKASGKAVVFWTKRAENDADRLDWFQADGAAAVKEAMEKGRYIGSEWCDSRPGGPVAACDAYLLRRREWNQYARKDLVTEYYLKFAISKTGTMLLVCQCHPPKL